LKIIIIGPAFPLRGGIAHLNESLCRAFIKEGDTAEIVSFSLQYPSFLFPGKTQKEEGNPPTDITIHTKINSVNPLNWFSVASFIKKQKPDLVIIRYWLPFMASCLGTIARLIKLPNTKIVAICDNIIPHEKRPGDKQLTQYFVNSCDAFVVMSKSVEDDLRKFDTVKPSTFIPHPVYDIFGKAVNKEVAQKKLNLNPADKHILFFGFIRKYKGLDLLIKALGIIKHQTSNIKLIVAGEFYDNKDEYLQLIKENGLENNVILHSDFIPSEEVKYYFCAADIIVQPYHTATQSGVTQIAYHFARPMLVTNVGGLAEIVTHNRVGYVTETNAESIAAALTDFYQNNREKEFSENAAIDSNKFSWENMVKGIKELVTKL
jgi:glycosyltransferase involved in cell wall biosynthesis